MAYCEEESYLGKALISLMVSVLLIKNVPVSFLLLMWIILVAPKGSGTSLRTMFLEGRGLNSSYAIFKTLPAVLWSRDRFGIGMVFGLSVRKRHSNVKFILTWPENVVHWWCYSRFVAGAIWNIAWERSYTFWSIQWNSRRVDSVSMPLFAKNGMDWMYANCSTTAQRGALDWIGPFHDAIKPVMRQLWECKNR